MSNSRVMTTNALGSVALVCSEVERLEAELKAAKSQLASAEREIAHLQEDVDRQVHCVGDLYQRGGMNLYGPNGIRRFGDSIDFIRIEPKSYHHMISASDFDWMRRGTLDVFEKKLAAKIAKDIRNTIVDALYK